MPELPEVETVCRGIEKNLKDQTIQGLSLTRRKIRFNIPDDIEKRCEGQTLLTVHRRGKYALLDLSNQETVIIHLGMSGRILIAKPNESLTREKHDHALFTFANNSQMIFRDPRRFGILSIEKTENIPSHPYFASMGIEPLSNDLNSHYLKNAFINRSGPIKTVLLDQKVIAGLGNIYVCEALYGAGISPLRPAKSLTTAEIETLIPNIRSVLQRAIESGGSSLRDFQNTSGEMGYFQYNFHVYDQENQPCPDCHCNLEETNGIQRIVQAGRSTFYCSTRQR